MNWRLSPFAGDVFEDHAGISRQELPRDGERQVVGDMPIGFRAHADRADAQAEKARIEVPELIRVLQVEHIRLDDGLQLGMRNRQWLARDGNDAADFRRSDQPAQHSVADHSRCAEEKDVDAISLNYAS